MNKRALLAGICDRLGATGMMLGLRRSARASWLPVLTFHRVAELPPGYLFDDQAVDSTPRELEQRLAMLKSYFTPIGIDDVVQYVDGGTLPNNPVLVTFDDGYRDNYETALPILMRAGVKATFFIATDYIEQRRVFWWDRVNYLVKSSALGEITMRDLTLPIANTSQRRAAIRTLLDLVKPMPAGELERFLGELATATDVRWTDDLERRFADQLLMTWDQIRELRRAGMDVQSHAPAQLAGSRRTLEAQLDEPICAVSYPVGDLIEDRAAMQSAGYKVGFTNATGCQPLSELDPFNVHRISLDAGTPPALFKAMLAMPRVFESS